MLISTTEDGWHNGGTVGDSVAVYSGNGLEYRIDGSIVTYQQYLTQFSTATNKEIRLTPSPESPGLLFLFSYLTSGATVRMVLVGNLLGDFVEDYIFDDSVGTLDAFNGKFAVTPEYPNGTYAYFMTAVSYTHLRAHET